METTALNKEQVLETLQASNVARDVIELNFFQYNKTFVNDTIAIYKGFKGTNKEFALEYPYETLWICRYVPNFVDKETFLHCCEYIPSGAFEFHGKELLKNDFELFKRLAFIYPNGALWFHGIQLLETHFELFKELALEDPFNAFLYYGKELLENHLDFYQKLCYECPNSYERAKIIKETVLKKVVYKA